MQALNGVRILDLSGGIAGPLGVLQLAEHGADVIKIEPPGGRSDRGVAGVAGYNRSRRSVTLNLKEPDGVAVLKELCATVDVLVEAFAPGTMAGLGLDYESLRDEFPRLVYCSIPAWPTGMRYEDMPGYEALVHARTGQQWETTSFRTGPIFLHSPIASMGAMFLVPIGIMSAIVARDRTERGQHVEISLFQGVMSLTTQIWNWTDKGQFLLQKSHPPSVHQASIYECANGEWIHAATMSGIPPTRTEGSILGVEEVPYAAMAAMSPAERADHEASRKAAFKKWDRSKLIEEFHAAGLGAEAIVAPHERFDHPQLRETGAVVEVIDPEVGPTTQLGVTIFLEGTPGEVQGPQPLAGAHTDEVLRSLGHADEEIAGLREGSDLMPGPLEGYRVIDFGQYLAGPFGPMLLADLGADVIKVEPTRGDGMRGAVVGSFMGCQRGKRDIAIDVKQPEGLRLALELVATADIVHHNMTLGTADRLGLGFEACKAVKPDIVYCNTFMYGARGPLAHMGGLDPLGQAASGIEWEQGPVAEGNPPLWYRYGHGDVAAAMPSVTAVLIALHHRNRTGEGQFLWASLFHGSMLYTADCWLDADGSTPVRPTLDKEQLGLDALYHLYETQDGWLQLAAVRDEHWDALARAIGRPELLEDARFATAGDRAKYRSALTEILTEAFMGDLATNWRRGLRAAGVPVEVSVDTWDGETILFDRELERLGLVTEYEHPLLGRVRQFGNLITFSDTPGKQERAAPMLGQHTGEVLREMRYDDATVDDYHDRGIVSSPGADYRYPV